MISDNLYRTTQGHRAGAGSAHGKIILLGEHMVVYGMPAIAVPMPELRAHATAYGRAAADSPAADAVLDAQRSRSHLVHVDPRSDGRSGDSVAVAAHAFMRLVGYTERGVDLVLRCAIPPSRGLGASAACAVAAVRALADHLDCVLTPEILHRAVQHGEDMAHGTASGIDAVACMAEGPIWFESGWVQPLSGPTRARIVVADTGITGSTRAAVTQVRTQLASEINQARTHLVNAAALTRMAAEDLAAGRVAELGKHCTAFHTMLCEIGVSCGALDRLVAAAIEAGAAGAKLTGGGLGGCMIALVEDDEQAATVRTALQQGGAVRTWTIALGCRA
ncbi:mevalonate kinase [Nocardia brasiliensis]|uniref:mevalonate kinase n=1 Tax=Nocardia brasiliensis TaxID=37326 RepID=UPI00245401A4|nr:mevalonate kinase [Nocardia brasiliensis]